MGVLAHSNGATETNFPRLHRGSWFFLKRAIKLDLMGNNTRRMVAVGGFFWAGLLAVAGWGDVKPNNLFSDHLVLQSGVPVPVWGTAEAGENVTVSFAGQKQSAVAGADGKWMVSLAKLEAGTPGEMTIAGKNSVVVHDVLVGEVWVGSGQSNMQFSVGPSPVVKAYSGVTNAEKEIAAATYPQLRMYTVKPTLAGSRWMIRWEGGKFVLRRTSKISRRWGISFRGICRGR